MTLFYVLSYEDTGCIVSYCQLDKRDLSKPGAVTALLDQLVRDTLEINLSLKSSALTGPVPKITINKTQLELDPVDVPDGLLTKFLTEPQTFLLDLSDPSAKPGDGKIKKFVESPIVPNSYTFPTATTFQVAFQGTAPQATRFYAIIDGQPQSPFDVPQPAPANVTFNPGTLLKGLHSVMFMGRGVQPFFGFAPSP